MAQAQQRSYEVEFVNHNHEFSRFYKQHKDLCDEISGIKRRTWYEGGEEKTKRIERYNFLFAIRRLNAFIIDNIHYLSDKTRRERIMGQMEQLEDEYINDEQYQEYAHKEKETGKLVEDEKIPYNKKYFHYLTRCFDISHELNDYLQESLMISPADIRKTIKYFNEETFFNSLAEYRDEMSNDIAEFSFKTLLKNFKKILGYHYTYRILVPKRDLYDIDALIRKVFSYIMHRETLRLHNRAMMEKLLPQEEAEVKRQAKLIKSVFAEIYKMTNESLSEKNILPKANSEVLIDKTLI